MLIFAKPPKIIPKSHTKFQQTPTIIQKHPQIFWKNAKHQKRLQVDPKIAGLMPLPVTIRFAQWAFDASKAPAAVKRRLGDCSAASLCSLVWILGDFEVLVVFNGVYWLFYGFLY